MGPSVVGSLGSARHAGTRDFCSAFAALVGPIQNFGPVQFIFSSPYTLFHFICPHRPASWAGSGAASPVSY
jgi:hypothetical protein